MNGRRFKNAMREVLLMPGTSIGLVVQQKSLKLKNQH